MKITTKTNGYTISAELDTMVKRFEYVASVLFPEWEMEHFYYGDKLVMTSICNGNGEGAHFNITAKRVSFNSHALSTKNKELCESMTWNDECFNGRLLELVNF